MKRYQSRDNNHDNNWVLSSGTVSANTVTIYLDQDAYQIGQTFEIFEIEKHVRRYIDQNPMTCHFRSVVNRKIAKFSLGVTSKLSIAPNIQAAGWRKTLQEHPIRTSDIN